MQLEITLRVGDLEMQKGRRREQVPNLGNYVLQKIRAQLNRMLISNSNGSFRRPTTFRPEQTYKGYLPSPENGAHPRYHTSIEDEL